MTEKPTYGEWQRCGYGMTFMEYLGVEVPTVYRVPSGNRTLFQYRKGEIAGAWCNTKKAAKESYKQLINEVRKLITAERRRLREIGKTLSPQDLDALKDAAGCHKHTRPSEWLEVNCYICGHSGPDRDTANRLESLGLMENCGPFQDGFFYQVTEDGCRLLGVPESRISDHRFL